MTDMMITVKMPLWQKIAGWIMIAMHLIFLPELVALFCDLTNIPLNNYTLNIADFVIGWILVIGLFFGFLKANFKTFGRSVKKSFLAIAVGLAVYFALNIAVNLIINALTPEGFSNANEAALDAMAEHYQWALLICTVLLVPLTEEVLYRGVLHQILYQRNRILAYVISTFVFAAIHVVGYIGYTDGYSLFLAFHQYLPAGIALALAYELSDSIWAPIIIHSTINFIAMVL